MKSNEVPTNSFSVNLVEKDNFAFLVRRHSKNIRVIKMDVNKELMIPIINVEAKPRIGPVPTENKMIAVNKVVMLASKIALNENL